MKSIGEEDKERSVARVSEAGRRCLGSVTKNSEGCVKNFLNMCVYYDKLTGFVMCL